MRRPLLYLFTLLLVIASCCFSVTAVAQKQGKPLEETIPTWAIKKKRKNDAQKNMPRELPVRYIIITKTKGVLYGNPCAVQETQKMGFQYILLKKGQPGYADVFEKIDNNFNVKLGLVFRRSPFWKLILKKRIEKCRRNTGDFVGYLDQRSHADQTAEHPPESK